MLIDTHVHLNSERFNDDYKEVIKRAIASGVKKMIVVGFDKQTNKKAIELAEEFDFIYATVGFHPTIASKVKASDYELLVKQIKHDKVVGIGECGLDFYWDKKFITEQIEVFKRQIELSNQFNKPLVIHMRDATEPTYNVLSEYESINGVMHCYSGSSVMAHKFIKLGLYISLGGPVTFKNGHKPKEVAKEVSMDRLLIETDAPYLAPHPHRGKQNEPAFVKLVAEEISKIKNIAFEEVSKVTSSNAMKLFNIKE